MAIKAPRMRHYRRRDMNGLTRNRLRKLQRWADREAADLNGTGAGTDVAKHADDTSLDATSHGLVAGEGPFYATTTDTLPDGLVANQPYWVGEVVNAGEFRLRSRIPYGQPVAVTSAGTGTHTLTKGDSALDIVRLLKRNTAGAVQAATDIDDLV